MPRLTWACQLEEVGDVIQGQITFASALLDAQTVERWFQHYATLLEGFIADDRCAPGRVPLLTTQQHLLLDSFNPMPTDYPRESLLHLEFEKLAATQPDRAAVVEGDTVVSYSTVNQRANQVARHLLSVGVQPGDRVAISLPRGIDLVVGLLSILKAVPSTFPSTRRILASGSRTCWQILPRPLWSRRTRCSRASRTPACPGFAWSAKRRASARTTTAISIAHILRLRRWPMSSIPQAQRGNPKA